MCVHSHSLAPSGPITTFIIEPYVPHAEEYYLAVSSERLTYEISFCDCGGMNIEEHWDQLRTVKFDTNEVLSGSPRTLSPARWRVSHPSEPGSTGCLLAISRASPSQKKV